MQKHNLISIKEASKFNTGGSHQPRISLQRNNGFLAQFLLSYKRKNVSFQQSRIFLTMIRPQSISSQLYESLGVATEQMAYMQKFAGKN